MKLRWKKGTAGEQRGAFIVFTALTLWFLMMFVAFSVDFGNYYQHRSRLQNAADAAALAGVAKYTEEEIAANSAGAIAAPTLSKGRLVTLVENDKAVSASRTVRSQAQDYVTNNYGNLDIKDNKVWSEEVTEEKTENGVTQSTTTTHRYCRVDLVDTIPTFFARIFGVTSLDVKVSALALMDGSAENETWGKRLEGVGDRLAMLAPNMIWETLVNDKSNKAFTITDLKYGNKTTTGNVGYGQKNNRYYVMTGVAEKLLYTGKDETQRAHTDENGFIIGYKEPTDGGICAAPIYATGGTESKLKERATTKVFVIQNNEGVTYTDEGEIFALYLNRDHITQRTGARDRFTKIIVNYMKGTSRNTVDEKNTYTVPLYARLESEPIRIGERSVMPVHGVFIDVKTTRLELGVGIGSDGKITVSNKAARPFVLAYDGPDPLRGKLAPGKTDVEDAPWIATNTASLEPEKFSILKPDQVTTAELNYEPSQIRDKIEPLLLGNPQIKFLGDSTYLEAHNLVKSALATSGPIEVNIEEADQVFYGVIFAPHSKVTIKGTGIIYGFIAAREIDASDWHPSGAKSVLETETVSLPAMSTIVRDGSKDIYDYEKRYFTDEYMVAFNRYEDFTDAKYYSSILN